MNKHPFAQIEYDNYYQMLSDTVRMQSFKKAIEQTVRPGDIVVDLGTGTGILAIWALQAGAAKVYAIEKTDAIRLAMDIAHLNDCKDRIEFIHGNSKNVQLPEQADVLISETLGSFAIDENTLEFTIDARNRMLKEGGSLIPRGVELFVAPADSALTYEKIDFWRKISGIDFSPAFDLFSRKIMIESIEPGTLLADPVSIGKIDLESWKEPAFASRVYMQMKRSGIIHGVAGWFKVTLADEIEICTAPDEPVTHWKQAFFPFQDPIEIICNDVLDWSVCVEAGDSDNTRISYHYRCTQLKNELC